MNSEFKISYFPVGTIAQSDLTYVIIGAREGNKWIFVRHYERNSWELPAGHIENNESALEAAHRELFEETGTTKSEMRAILDYSVITNESPVNGRIFFARIIDRGPVPDSEIAEIIISETSPLPATYPEAHLIFIDILEKFVSH